VNENGFPSLFVFRILDVNIKSPPGPKATLRRYSKLQAKRNVYNNNQTETKYKYTTTLTMNEDIKVKPGSKNCKKILNVFYRYL